MFCFLASELYKWNQVRNIVNNGTPIIATITAMGDGSLRGTVSPDNPVELQFTYNDHECAVDGWLEGRTESISMKQSVPIRIDPNDPTKWTYLTQTPPVCVKALGPGLMARFGAGRWRSACCVGANFVDLENRIGRAIRRRVGRRADSSGAGVAGGAIQEHERA